MQPELKKSILEYVLGERKELELVGPPALVATIYEAADSASSLLCALREEKNEETIKSLMKRRLNAANRFKKLTGEDWDI
jgi:hypothetical protein